jgi:hypothetical protein
MRESHPHDMFVWPDGSWMHREEHFNYNEKVLTNDFIVLYYETMEWYDFITTMPVA